MLRRSDYDPYQNEAEDFLFSTERAGLWLDMGLGKTVIAGGIIARCNAAQERHRWLIVAPIKVAVNTWPAEFAAWEHLCGLEYTVIRPTGDEPEIRDAVEAAKTACRRLGLSGSRAAGLIRQAQTQAEEWHRQRLARSPAQVHIVNHERFEWLVRLYGTRAKWPYTALIWDESDALRATNTKRFSAIAYIRKQLKRLILLTGTPAPEGYQDLFGPTFLMDGGERFGRVKGPFMKQYFDVNPYSRKVTLKKGSDDKIIKKMSGLVLIMKTERKDPLFVNRPVVLSNEQQATYNRMEEELAFELPDGDFIEAETASALAGKLLQLASGFIYDAERRPHWFHDEKIEELRQIQREAQGSPLLVGYWFKPSRERLAKAFPEAVVMDKEGRAEHAWNAGKIPMLLAHPRGSGHGIQLQKGPGHNLVYFDIPYPLLNYLQFIKRIDRRGQRSDFVKVFHIITRGTIDEGLVPRLREKESTQEYLLQRLRALRQLKRQRAA